MKYLAFILSLVTGILLLSVLDDLPGWGDASSPVNSYVSSYYLENSMKDTHVPNVVTTVLADYRSFDTMFETGVVFVAVIGIMAILRRSDSMAVKDREEVIPPYSPPDGFILRVATRMIVPFMQVFALYVIAHGHHSPGGGFQGGVILGASVILMALTGDLQEALKRLSEKWFIIFSAGGFFIFAAVGLLCLLYGGNFLDYSAYGPMIEGIFHGEPSIMARYHGMLWVEIGVGFTVMSAMFAIYSYLSSNGRLDRGL